MILVIDNYDSFTWNLVHLIGGAGHPVEVIRNDSMGKDEVLGLNPQGIVLSPGPCTPNEAGICVEMVHAAIGENIPLLGVCLGHQSIVQAAGGKIIRASRLMHGRTSEITITAQDELFAGMSDSFTATRYHSLVAERESLPVCFEVFADAADDNEIMAVRWKGQQVWGLQFHPESIASEYGRQITRNFLNALPQTRSAA